jgi:hypothetical protein
MTTTTHRLPRYRIALVVSLLAALTPTVFSATPASAAPGRASALPETAHQPFTILAAYRGTVKGTSYTLWTPVKNVKGDRPWLASLQPNATSEAKRLKMPVLLPEVRDSRGQVRPFKGEKDTVYQISGTMSIPVKCPKPVKKSACREAVVMRADRVDLIGGACKEAEYYEHYTYVCGTSTEVVGIQSMPGGEVDSAYIEGRVLQMSGRRTYPIPFGGRIDGSLATGSIALPVHSRGTCNVAVTVVRLRDNSRYDTDLTRIDLKYPC